MELLQNERQMDLENKVMEWCVLGVNLIIKKFDAIGDKITMGLHRETGSKGCGVKTLRHDRLLTVFENRKHG